MPSMESGERKCLNIEWSVLTLSSQVPYICPDMCGYSFYNSLLFQSHTPFNSMPTTYKST